MVAKKVDKKADTAVTTKEEIKTKSSRKGKGTVDKEAPFKVFEVTLPGNIKIQKRFREGREPQAVVVGLRLTGEPFVYRWTSSISVAQGLAKSVTTKYVEKKDRFKEIWVLEGKDIKFVRVQSPDEGALPREVTEDRSWTREYRNKIRAEKGLPPLGSHKTKSKEPSKEDSKSKKKGDAKFKTKKKSGKKTVADASEAAGAEAFTSKKRALSAAKALGISPSAVVKDTDGGWIINKAS